MIYKCYASGQITMDGVIIQDGVLVATVDTECLLSNVLTCIRMQQLRVVTISEETTEEVPTKGKSKKT